MRDYQSRNDSARQAILDIIRDAVGKEPKSVGKARTAAGTPPESVGPDNARLPSESELSRRIGLSVPTIREALRTLEQEGYISKKHGMGNYYHASTLETRMRIDTILDFSDLLADGGYRVHVSQTELRLLSATNAAAGRERDLCAKVGPLYRYDRVYSAGDRPAILTKNYIPRQLLDPRTEKNAGAAECAPAPKENIIDVLWSQGRIRVTHSIEAMTPGLADSAERALFGLKARSPLIRWSETFYTYDDSIVGYADVSFNPDIMNMRLLRKWS